MTRQIIPQAGAIPYRIAADGAIEVLLITTHAGEWSIPKGLIDPGNTAEQTAVLESEEEAGVIGVVSGPSLGQWFKKKFGGTCQIDVFPLRVETVLETWDEQSFRERCWLPIETAAERIDKAQVRPLIKALRDFIRKGDARPPPS